jgi:hypothetical protein
MIERCENPNNAHAADYGGRGISVCERWRHDFQAFLADMGRRPNGMSIDRINNDGNYEPGNCRWATNKEQASNRRYCVMLTHNGETMTASDWARRVGIKPSTMLARLRAGCSHVDAITRPTKRGGPWSKNPRPLRGADANA